MKKVLNLILIICILTATVSAPTFAASDGVKETIKDSSEVESLLSTIAKAGQNVTLTFNANGGKIVYGEFSSDYSLQPTSDPVDVMDVGRNEFRDNSFDLSYWSQDSAGNKYFYVLDSMQSNLYVTNGTKRLVGWSTDTTAENIITEIPNDSITLYAIWVDVCVITYMAKGLAKTNIQMAKALNDGTDLWINITYDKGNKVGTMMQPYVFRLGPDNQLVAVDVTWALDPEGNNVINDLAEFIPDGNVTLYAIIDSEVIQSEPAKPVPEIRQTSVQQAAGEESKTTGEESKAAVVEPKATVLSKVKAGKKSMVVKWKKQSENIAGYQIQYSTSKKFKSGSKTITIKNPKTTTKKIKKLKSKKKYYVRIRTYKKADGKTYYSKWSKAKSVKIK